MAVASDRIRCLVLPARVFRAIERECALHPETETGGLLAGSTVENALVIGCTVPPGPAAHRSADRFTPDTVAQQLVLDALAMNFGPRLDYAGDWHRHSAEHPTPSRRDLRTARAIVTSPSWDVTEAVFPIATFEHGGLAVRAFLMARGQRGFVEIPVAVVPDADPRVRSILAAEPEGMEVDHAPGCRRGSGRVGHVRWPFGPRVRTRA